MHHVFHEEPPFATYIHEIQYSDPYFNMEHWLIYLSLKPQMKRIFNAQN